MRIFGFMFGKRCTHFCSFYMINVHRPFRRWLYDDFYQLFLNIYIYKWYFIVTQNKIITYITLNYFVKYAKAYTRYVPITMLTATKSLYSEIDGY